MFVIVLSTPSYEAAFGHGSAASYLNTELRRQGELLSNYHTLSSSPLPEYIAMVSGQAPNHDTTQDCPTYSEFPGSASPAGNGLVPGTGCVYPNTALTIGDQFDRASSVVASLRRRDDRTVLHPNAGAADTRHRRVRHRPQPFVYFHSLLDLGDCQSDDVPYRDRLATHWAQRQRTPSYAFNSPEPCDSGRTRLPGRPARGHREADSFLKRPCRAILDSPAYRASGALVIVFTAAPGTAAPGSAAPGSAAPGTGAAHGGPVRTWSARALSLHPRPDSTDAAWTTTPIRSGARSRTCSACRRSPGPRQPRRLTARCSAAHSLLRLWLTLEG